jgi:hypothetical protein
MLRVFAFGLVMFGMTQAADEPGSAKLVAPTGWGGESIPLPPGFAPDMKLEGIEHIRFAPGMMKPESDSFFSYAFVFELKPQPVLTEAVLKHEFLTYYRGLCKAVLNGKLPEVDPETFTLKLQRVKTDKPPATDSQSAATPKRYIATVDWVEPFATKKPQTLNLEIQTWNRNGKNYVFACVSPQSRDTPIWTKLHTIRDDYLKKRGP